MNIKPSKVSCFIHTASMDFISWFTNLPGIGVLNLLFFDKFFKKILPLLYGKYYLNDNNEYIEQYYKYYSDKFIKYRNRTGNDITVPQILEIDNSNNEFREENILFKRSDNAFQLEKRLKDLTHIPFLNYQKYRTKIIKYEDNQLLRLTNIVRKENNCIELWIQSVMYEDVCRCHLCMDALGGGSVRNSASENVRKVVHVDGKIGSLKDSRMPNPIGVNYLFFTASGDAIIPRRSGRVAVHPYKLSPSASGLLHYSDFFDGMTLKKVYPREPEEELKIFLDHINGSLSFLGLTRELSRGGQPEIYFSATTNLGKEELQDRYRKATHRYEHTSSSKWEFWPFGKQSLESDLGEEEKEVLLKSFQSLINEYHNQMSPDLLTNLILWLKRKIGDYSHSPFVASLTK